MPPRSSTRRRRSGARPAPRAAASGLRGWLSRGRPRARLLKFAALVLGGPLLVGLTVAAYLWIDYGRIIDGRLGGEQRPIPRIFARPFELRAGDGLSPAQLEQRLNDIGYARREEAAQPGQFSLLEHAVVVMPRASGEAPSRPVRVDFTRGAQPVVSRLTALADPGASEGRGMGRLALEAPMLTALAAGEKRRYTPLAGIPRSVVDAVIVIEDRRFFDHPGVDPIGAVRALVTNLRGTRPYLVGGSTLTQQIVKNTFLTPAKTLRRKLQEQFMALVLESRFTKEQILELYLNDVTLGQRGPFEIHGVAEAARIFFGKDVTNLSLAESATIAGLIQSPSRLSPFRHPEEARERRNLVLREMAEAGMVARETAKAAAAEPLTIVARALENQAPYFVDYVTQRLEQQHAGLLEGTSAVDVYTTLDVQMQRLAQEALAAGLAQVDRQLAARKRRGRAQAALIAVDPRTGEILAFVGGRAYNQSQFNRVVAARRQPGSVFKPFVYLAAFERMGDEGRGDLSPATVVIDEPTTFADGDQGYAPANYQDEYGGPVTLRDALAHSRNVVAIKVAEQAGFDRVAALWQRVGVGAAARPYPSIALGVFEATPLEMATAYTLFANEGMVRPLQSVRSIVQDGTARDVRAPRPRRVARANSTFLVLDMMRSVMNQGTAAGARTAGFTLDAAGKTGTTNDQRDAWFIGFTPELLTAVWVGFDENQPLGLTGSQAALPIWTTFMKRALAGRPNLPFPAPPDVAFADVDLHTGQLATPLCPMVIHEAFLPGSEPREFCELHGGGHPVNRFFSRIGSLFGRIVR